MNMHWCDVEKRLDPGVWDGLRLSIADRRSPLFVVSACPPRCLRLAAGDTPLLWARVWDDYYGYEILRAELAEPRSIVPPIPFAVVDEIVRNDADDTMPLWARHFAQALADSAYSPLSDGEWALEPYAGWPYEPSLSVREIEAVLAYESREYVDWCGFVPPLTLRAPSSEDHGRVKAWRKLACRGELPPVLLYWISGLAACVVLDGHDRLLAARLEGLPIRALTLSRVYDMSKDAEHQQTVWNAVGLAFEHSMRKDLAHQDHRKFGQEKANRILLEAYMPLIVAMPTLANVLEGSYPRWRAEVVAEAGRQSVDIGDLLDDAIAGRSGLTQAFSGPSDPQSAA